MAMWWVLLHATEAALCGSPVCRRAQASLQPFMHSLEQHGWQVAPFMLSSTEKRGYVMMGG